MKSWVGRFGLGGRWKRFGWIVLGWGVDVGEEGRVWDKGRGNGGSEVAGMDGGGGGEGISNGGT